VVTGMVFSCTIKESTSTFHRDGELMGHVEIGVEFATLAYSGSYSPIHLGELASIQQFPLTYPLKYSLEYRLLDRSRVVMQMQ
jgi:hypothetical protein